MQSDIKDLSTRLDQQIKRFSQYLIYLNLTVEQTAHINEFISEAVIAHTMIEVAKMMNEGDQERWDKFLATKPTDVQQLLILDEFCKRKGNIGIGDIQAQMTISLTQSFMDQMKKIADVAETVSDLSDEEVESILQKIGKENG